MSEKARVHIAHKVVLREDVEEMIFWIRGQRVMIDHDLSGLYGVQTKYLNRQVRRNLERFPAEFMFQLSRDERDELVTNWHRLQKLKHSSSLPYAFTENGVAMLAGILNSDRAVKMSIHIVKTFVKFRRWVEGYKELREMLAQLEASVGRHDKEIKVIFKALHELVAKHHTQKSRHRVGFHGD